MEDFLPVVRLIDERIKYMETKLEKPYLIGFNHNDVPETDAMNIVDELIKDIKELTTEQSEFESFLVGDIQELTQTKDDLEKYILERNSELDDYETYALENIPQYAVFVPPEELSKERLIEYHQINFVEANQMTDEVDGRTKNSNDNNGTRDPVPRNDDHVLKANLESISNSLELCDINDSVLEDIAEPILISPASKKKLNFDVVSTNKSEDQKISNISSADKKIQMKNETNLAKKLLTDSLKKKALLISDDDYKENLNGQCKSRSHKSDLEESNLSGFSDIGMMKSPDLGIIPTNLTTNVLNNDLPDKRRNTLSGRRPIVLGVSNYLSKENHQNVNSVLQDKFNRPLKSISDNLSRRDTLGYRKDLPLNQSSSFRRITLNGRKDLPTDNAYGFRIDTLNAREDLSTLISDGFRRNTLGGRKDLPSGIVDGFQRDTLSGRKDLPSGTVDRFRRDTLSGRKDLPSGTVDRFRRDTLSGRKDLPIGISDGFRRDTLNIRKDLPVGLKDCYRRDTLSGEKVNSRRLSHYVAVPSFKLGVLPPSPKEPVTSDLGLKLIGRYKY